MKEVDVVHKRHFKVETKIKLDYGNLEKKEKFSLLAKVRSFGDIGLGSSCKHFYSSKIY